MQDTSTTIADYFWYCPICGATHSISIVQTGSTFSPKLATLECSHCKSKWSIDASAKKLTLIESIHENTGTVLSYDEWKERKEIPVQSLPSNGLPIFLSKNETVCFRTPAEQAAYTVKQVVQTTPARALVFATKIQQQQMPQQPVIKNEEVFGTVDTGEVFVTNIRVVFVGKKHTFSVPLSDLQSIHYDGPSLVMGIMTGNLFLVLPKAVRYEGLDTIKHMVELQRQ